MNGKNVAIWALSIALFLLFGWYLMTAMAWSYDTDQANLDIQTLCQMNNRLTELINTMADADPAYDGIDRFEQIDCTAYLR